MGFIENCDIVFEGGLVAKRRQKFVVKESTVEKLHRTRNYSTLLIEFTADEII